jgi:outer membrane immunogenic protein
MKSSRTLFLLHHANTATTDYSFNTTPACRYFPRYHRSRRVAITIIFSVLYGAVSRWPQSPAMCADLFKLTQLNWPLDGHALIVPPDSFVWGLSMRHLGLVVIAGALAMSGAASAADLARRPVYKAAPAPAVFNWSGFYVGGNAGWGWGEGNGTVIGVPPVPAVPIVAVGSERSNDRDGFLGGAQIGFNWQAPGSPWVFGIEADWSWTDASTSSAVAGIGAISTTLSDTNWYATVTGRIGYAVDTWLWYVKGGVAFMDVDYQSTTTTAAGTFASNAIGDTRTGWTVGVGVEQALLNNWSWKLEYNYLDFGSEQYAFTTTVAGVTGTTTNDLEEQAHIVKFGVNYRFR